MPQYLVAGYLPDNYDPSLADEATGRDIHALNKEMIAAGVRILLGTGKRIFADGTPSRSFELVSTKALPSGVILTPTS
jgi:hypothetical protein